MKSSPFLCFLIQIFLFDKVPDDQTLEQSPLDQSYFTVREQSLHGDCQTSYTIHPLPQSEAFEIEEKMEQEEKMRNTQEHLQGGLSQGAEVCRGKKYWQITKTRNFDNCLERPVYQKWSGIRAMCDSTKASCKDVMNVSILCYYAICIFLEKNYFNSSTSRPPTTSCAVLRSETLSSGRP